MPITKMFCSPIEVHWLTPDKTHKKYTAEIELHVLLKKKIGVMLVF